VAWESRLPMTAAEQHIDFEGHNTHIVDRRAAVEKAALPIARRLAAAVGDYGLPTQTILDLLAERLEKALAATARYGFTEARKEIRALRTTDTALAYSVPDVGQFSEQARQGLDGVLAHVKRRALETARKVSDATAAAVRDEQDKVTKLAIATSTAARVLHNHVLELVGETLNMGRTAGAMSLKEPPTFAMRSEQLDKNTCDACSEEHGEIYEVGSDEMFTHMPPTYCYGGGRCRGVFVFSDYIGQVQLPEAA
jgi:hypothetical protein